MARKRKRDGGKSGLLDAFKRGYEAGRKGELASTCPYLDYRNSVGRVTWSRSWINGWMNGWKAGRQARANAQRDGQE